MILPSLLLAAAALAWGDPYDDGVDAYQEQRYEEAMKILAPLASAGNDFAAVYVGKMHHEGWGVVKDWEKAAEFYQISAKRGNPAGEFLLAWLYKEGEGVIPSEKEACRLFEATAKTGNPKALANAGVCLWDGRSDTKDQAKAVEYWKKGAEDDDDWVNNNNLGFLYYDGKFISKDLALARKHFIAAYRKRKKYDVVEKLEQWEKTAPYEDKMNELLWPSLFVAMSDHLPPVDQKALEWVKGEAERGNPTAMRILAGWYREGRGVPKDAEEAAAWLAKANAPKGGAAPAAASPGTAPVPAAVASDVDKPGFKLKERPEDFALVVGVEKYRKLPAASWAERDAAAVREHLLALGVPNRNLIFLTGEDATRGKLQAYLLEWLPKNVKPESRVFFYYSGHGAPDPETQRSFLVPWDGDAEFLQSTAFSVRDLYAALNRLPAREIVVALDSCFSGAGGRSVLAPGLRPLVTRVAEGNLGRIALLSASSGEQVTGALDEQGHGLFTYYLLKGLGGEAKDADGRVTVRGLYDYLKPKVEDEARRRNRNQSPTLSGEGGVLASF